MNATNGLMDLFLSLSSFFQEIGEVQMIPFWKLIQTHFLDIEIGTRYITLPFWQAGHLEITLWYNRRNLVFDQAVRSYWVWIWIFSIEILFWLSSFCTAGFKPFWNAWRFEFSQLNPTLVLMGKIFQIKITSTLNTTITSSSYHYLAHNLVL